MLSRARAFVSCDGSTSNSDTAVIVLTRQTFSERKCQGAPQYNHFGRY